MRDWTGKAAGRASLLLSLIAFAGFALLPHLGVYRTMTVLSNSMEPSFEAGDVIVLTPGPLREVRRGDVLAYATPVGDRHVVTHRVVRLVEPGDRPVVVTKGDASAKADPWQARLEGGVAWRHRLTIPYAGHALLFLRKPGVRSAFLYVAPALLALFWLQRIWRLPPRTLRKATSLGAAAIVLLVPPSAAALWSSGASVGGQALGAATLPAPGPPTATITCVPRTSLSVGLSWPAAPNATGYDVRRGTSSGGPYSLVGTTSATSYTDATVAQQTTYHYVVVAKRAGWTSASSAQRTVLTPKLASCN